MHGAPQSHVLLARPLVSRCPCGIPVLVDYFLLGRDFDLLHVRFLNISEGAICFKVTAAYMRAS